jgi:hypothetical protein
MNTNTYNIPQIKTNKYNTNWFKSRQVNTIWLEPEQIIAIYIKSRKEFSSIDFNKSPLPTFFLPSVRSIVYHISYLFTFIKQQW